MTQPDRDSAGVIAPPPLIFLGGLALGIALDVVLGGSVPDGLWPLGVVVILAGVTLQGTFIAAFRRARTNIRPDRPTNTIVTTGPYRFTRNPAYIGMTLIFAGIAVVADTPWALVMLVPTLVVVDRGVIAREERYLEQKFGEAYLDYKSRVRRWL